MRKKHIDPAAGQRLNEVRQHRGISQGELARTLGVKVGTIQGYEHARIGISATRLDQLARGLQCETADLMMPPGAPLPRYRFQGRRQQRRRRSSAQQRQARKVRAVARIRRNMQHRIGIAVALWHAQPRADAD